MDNKEYRFEVYIDYDFEEPEYVVKYYDLPVGGQGKDIESAIKEAQDNLKQYIKMSNDLGMKLPEPSKHIKVSDLSGKLTLRVSKSLHAEIIKSAAEEGVSINSFLNDAINYYVYKKVK